MFSEASWITWIGGAPASIGFSHEERKQEVEEVDEVEEVEVVEEVEDALRHTADNWALQISTFVRST